MVIYLFIWKKNVAMLFPDQQIKIVISIYLNVRTIYMTFISRACSCYKTLIFFIQQNCLNRFYFAINGAIFSRLLLEKAVKQVLCYNYYCLTSSL